MRRFLPYGRQALDQDDLDAVTAVLQGDWLTQGPTVAAFEKAVAEKLDVPYALACANGTAALHLAALALGLGPGDAVVVPSITFLATANAARYVGAEVAFADVDPDTGLMRRTDAEAAIRRAEAQGWRVRALFPVHLAGQTADMDGLADLAWEKGMFLVEDACHAIGTRTLRPDGRTVAVGACDRSDLAVFSFHPVKTIATGEGGMVTARDPELAERIARYRTHGMVRDASRFEDSEAALDPDGQPNPWYYEMPEPGFNYRLTDIQAALGLSQLRKLDRFVLRRQELVEIYDRELAGLAPAIRPAGRAEFCRPGWHLYVALIDFDRLGMTRGRLMRELSAQGIGTQVHYIPVHRQPYYRDRYPQVSLPGADAWYGRCLSLPLFPAMENEDVVHVVQALQRAAALT